MANAGTWNRDPINCGKLAHSNQTVNYHVGMFKLRAGPCLSHGPSRFELTGPVSAIEQGEPLSGNMGGGLTPDLRLALVAEQSRSLAPIRLFLAAGIVFRIDVVELHRCHAVNLDYRLAAGRYVMVHVGIEIGKATR